MCVMPAKAKPTSIVYMWAIGGGWRDISLSLTMQQQQPEDDSTEALAVRCSLRFFDIQEPGVPLEPSFSPA